MSSGPAGAEKALPLPVLEDAEEQDAVLVAAVREAAARSLYYLPEYAIEVPPSAIEALPELVALRDLFVAPSASELGVIARGPDGLLRRLSPEQQAQLRWRGTFDVPSASYPGERHTWQLSLILQEGAGRTREKLRAALAIAAERIVIKVRERLVGARLPSAWRSARNAARGVRDLAGILFGWRERRARYDAYGLDIAVEAARLGAVLAGVHRTGPSTWSTPDGDVVDLRLEMPSIRAPAEPILARIGEAVARTFRRDLATFRQDEAARLRARGVPESEIPQALADREVEEIEMRLHQAILTSEPLERLSAGLCRRVVAHAEAIAAVRAVEIRHEARGARRREEIAAGLRKGHPIRSRIRAWLEERVSAAVAPERARDRFAAHDEALAELRSRGLADDAWAFERNLGFARGEEALRAKLAAEQVPAREYTHLRAFWRKRAWRTERLSIDPPAYQVIRHAAYVVRADAPLWRWRSAALRAATWANNGTRWLLVDNLWDGPLGLRGLLFAEPFVTAIRVDAAGAIEPDPTRPVPTLRSRLRAIWRDVRASLEASERGDDDGFLSRRITRVFSRVWNLLIKGPLTTLLVVIGQPILTIVNLVASAVLVLLAVAWAPAASALCMVRNLVLWDYDDPDVHRGRRPWLPLFRHIVVDVGFRGVLPLAVGLSAGLVIEPLIALVVCAWALPRALVRRLYDKLLFSAVIHPLARIPARDSVLARRIAGPGLSSSYFFQTRADLALLCLEAALEREELALYERDATAEIEGPRRAYARFLASMLGAVHPSATTNVLGHPLLDETTARHKERLDEAVRARREALDRLLRFDFADRVRLAPDELGATMARGAALCESFVTSRLAHRASAAHLWEDRELASGDYAGLAGKLLAEVFSPAFLTPLGPDDGSLRLDVAPLGLARVLRAIEKGEGPGDDLERAYAALPPTRQVAPSRPAVQPSSDFGFRQGLAAGLVAAGGDADALSELEKLGEPT